MQRPPELIKTTRLVVSPRLVDIIQRPPDLIQPISPVIFCKAGDYCPKPASPYKVHNSGRFLQGG